MIYKNYKNHLKKGLFGKSKPPDKNDKYFPGNAINDFLCLPVGIV